jgi:hypothetical protein
VLKKDTGLEDLAQNDSTTTERLSYEGSSMCYRVVRYGPQPLCGHSSSEDASDVHRTGRSSHQPQPRAWRHGPPQSDLRLLTQ